MQSTGPNDWSVDDTKTAWVPSRRTALAGVRPPIGGVDARRQVGTTDMNKGDKFTVWLLPRRIAFSEAAPIGTFGSLTGDSTDERMGDALPRRYAAAAAAVVAAERAAGGQRA